MFFVFALATEASVATRVHRRTAIFILLETVGVESRRTWSTCCSRGRDSYCLNPSKRLTARNLFLEPPTRIQATKNPPIIADLRVGTSYCAVRLNLASYSGHCATCYIFADHAILFEYSAVFSSLAQSLWLPHPV